MERFARFKYQPCLPLGEDGRRVTGSPEHIALSRRAAGEGMVLLKNENDTLPLDPGTPVAVFGKTSLQYIKGGGGSGEVYCAYVHGVFKGLEQKEAEGKVKLFAPLKEFYGRAVSGNEIRVNEGASGEFMDGSLSMDELAERDMLKAASVRETQGLEPRVPDGLFNEARAFAETAIVTLGRFSTEGADRDGQKGDFYLTDSETELVNRVKSAFKNCVIVLDVGGVVDSEWFVRDGEIGAVLLAWQAGMEGGGAIADILCGDVDPSGRLVDTFARSIDDYPYSTHFNDSEDYVDYTEDIFVGYRYFETFPEAKDRVNYPFGFGLSYTTFSLTDLSAREENGIVSFSAKVTNTGKRAGKEVVQVYCSAPQGVLGKPARELRAFAKTKLLLPGESETLTASCKTADLASFDDLGKVQKSAYVLEKGSYEFYVGTSVRDTVKLDYTFEVKENIAVRQLTSLCAPVYLKERLTANGSLEKLPQGEARHRFGKNEPITAKAPAEVIPFDRVGKDCDLDTFIAQFTDRELCEFMGASDSTGVCNTLCFSAMPRLGVPAVPTADGPAGLRLEEKCGVAATAWPCATLLACSWDPALLEEIGRAGGIEVKENNLAVWLTPAMNIHRNPYCGRNFEYFSEDPLIAGKMAAAKVRGIQRNGSPHQSSMSAASR